jgi:Ca-activated chloride channel family protein
MKSNHMLLISSAILSVILLSSFYKPSAQQEISPLQPKESIQTEQRGPISLTAAFENDYYTRNNRTGYYYAELVAGKYEQEISYSAPLNISVVIDRSGSMAGDKIRYAKQAAKYLVDQLSPQDYISIVMYDHTVNVLQEATSVRNKLQIKQKIDGIVERGNTNLMGGALEGYQQVTQNYRPGYVNRVLLLSDGLANQGITDPGQIDRTVRQKMRQNGISISTFGVGRDYNEDLMTNMAESGAGNYYFIDRPERIASIFEQELNGLKTVVAKQVGLTITLPDFVDIEQVYGQPYEQNGRKLNVHFNDIFSEETKGVLIRYTIQANRNTPVRFGSSLNFYNARDERRNAITMNHTSEYTTNQQVYNTHFNEWVTTQVAIYESNYSLEKAMKEVDRGNYEEAKKIVEKNKAYIKSAPLSVQQAPAVKRIESVNADYGSSLDEVESMSVEDVKFLQKESKNSNYQIRAKKR